MGKWGEEELDRLVREHNGVLTTQEALKAGLTADGVAWARRKGRLRPLRHGVHTSARVWAEASPRVRHGLELLGQQRVRPELVACGLSAAEVWGLPLPNGPPPRPQLTVAREAQPQGADGRRAGALLRRSWLADGEIRHTRNGIRVTSIMRTVVDCARELEAPWGLAVADAALAQYPISPDRLILAVADRPFMPGLKRAEWVAAHARVAVESPLESLARAVVVLADLPELTPQVRVNTRAGAFRVDLLDEANRVITEADGKLKYTQPDELWKEKRREDALRDEGFEVVRFTMADYHHQPGWLTTYRKALDRSRRRGLPLKSA